MQAMKCRVYSIEEENPVPQRQSSLLKHHRESEEIAIKRLAAKYPQQVLGEDAVWFRMPPSEPCDLWGVNRDG